MNLTPYFDFHVNRIIKATSDLHLEPDSICEKCHTGEVNCIFCYCPFYPIPDCGGNFSMLPNGLKDCSACTLHHNPEFIRKFFRAIYKNPEIVKWMIDHESDR